MKKVILMLFVLLSMAAAVCATPTAVSFADPLQDQRTDRGIVFNVSYEATALAAGASVNMKIVTLEDLVMTFTEGGEGAFSMIIWEDTTLGVGAAVTPINENRTSSKVATTLATITSACPTLNTTVGTKIYVGNSNGTPITKRIVLDAGKTYAASIFNRGSGAEDLSLNLSFFQNALRIK